MDLNSVSDAEEDLEQQIQEIHKKNKEGDIPTKYKLNSVKIERNLSYHDPIFTENVTEKWFDKESFLKSMQKKNYF